MRNTKQKELILDIINHSYDHLDANTIYEECRKSLSNISLGTVYRNINQLVDSGLIKRIKTPLNIDRFDRQDSHAHFLCIKCNKVIDIFDKLIVGSPNIGNNKIIDYSLSYIGICTDCQEEEKKYGIKR